MWLRYQAPRIAALLPDDPDTALAVLDFAKALVEEFLAVPPRSPRKPRP